MMSPLDDEMEDLPIEAGLPSDMDHQNPGNGFLQVENSASAQANARYLSDSVAALSAVEHGASLNSNARYLADSAAGLSAALGKRWNGKQLEKDADQKTKAFLNGIVSAKTYAMSGIGRITGDIAALR